MSTEKEKELLREAYDAIIQWLEQEGDIRDFLEARWMEDVEELLDIG